MKPGPGSNAGPLSFSGLEAAAMIRGLDSVETITLFVEDLAAARAFYDRVFGAALVYEDEVSTVLGFGGLMVNLLRADQAPGLVAPLAVAPASSGARMMLTIRVDSVDAVCSGLFGLGIPLLNGPQDRPWGRRTAAFADPSGHVWEIAEELPAPGMA